MIECTECDFRKPPEWYPLDDDEEEEESPCYD